MGYSPGGKRGPGQMVGFKGIIHPDEMEIR